MLEIETKLSTAFYSQTNGQIEGMNQELEQYLQFFIYHRQKNWLEWLATAEFAVNNKTHLLTKVSLFIANYRRENGSGYKKEIKYRESNEVCRKDEKSIGRSGGSIKKSTREDKVIGRQREKESGSIEKCDKVILSIKDLVFKEWPDRKLVD